MTRDERDLALRNVLGMPVMVLEPIRRLSDHELEEARATFLPVTRYVPKDPYGPIPSSVRLVDFYRPSFVCGAPKPVRKVAA
jgi:hypothetical protein